MKKSMVSHMFGKLEPICTVSGLPVPDPAGVTVDSPHGPLRSTDSCRTETFIGAASAVLTPQIPSATHLMPQAPFPWTCTYDYEHQNFFGQKQIPSGRK